MKNIILSFKEDLCKGCELCVTACPLNILELNDIYINSSGYHPIKVTDISKCIGCANCATMCPDNVITIEKED